MRSVPHAASTPSRTQTSPTAPSTRAHGVARPVVEDDGRREQEQHPGEAGRGAEARRSRRTLRVGGDRVEPHRGAEGDRGGGHEGDRDGAGARAWRGPPVRPSCSSREQYHRRSVPASRDQGPLVAGPAGREPDRDRSPCRPGRRDGESPGMPPPGGATDSHTPKGSTAMTISHSPAPARSDVAVTTAPTDEGTRPYLRHGRMLSIGALAWSAAILLVGPGPARPARPGDLRHRLRPVPGRPDVPAPGALADPGPRRRPDRPRRPPRGVRRPRPGDGVDLRRRDRGLRPRPSPAGSCSTCAGRCRCSACSSSASGSRSPAAGRALSRFWPMVAESWAVVTVPSLMIGRRAASASWSAPSTWSSATPCSGCWWPTSAAEPHPPHAACA